MSDEISKNEKVLDLKKQEEELASKKLKASNDFDNMSNRIKELKRELKESKSNNDIDIDKEVIALKNQVKTLQEGSDLQKRTNLISLFGEDNIAEATKLEKANFSMQRIKEMLGVNVSNQQLQNQDKELGLKHSNPIDKKLTEEEKEIERKKEIDLLEIENNK